MKEELVDIDQKLNFVNETNILNKEDRYNNDSIQDLRKDYPDKIIKLEEALLNYMGENYLKFFKTEFPDNKWKDSTKKLAYLYEKLNIPDDYQNMLTI